MNILLTSAGRRTYMVDYFREALNGEGLVFAANSRLSPALFKADDYFLTPLIYDKGYIPFLIEKCKEHRIDMIVSLFDIDLPILSEHRSEFNKIGSFVAVSDIDTLSDCNDKYSMFLRLRKNGIGSPYAEAELKAAVLSLREGRLSWPVIVKPRFGMGSIGIFKAYGENELTAAYGMCRRECLKSYLRFESEKQDKCVIIEELIGGSEYGLDIISDFDGNYLSTIVRKKLAMRSGETDEAVILGEDDKEFKVLTDTGRRIAEAFKPKGLIDVDIIMDEDMVPYVIDINARFGGGYPFSQLAGSDVPRAYILLMQGRTEEAKGLLKVRAGTHGYKDIAIKRIK